MTPDAARIAKTVARLAAAFDATACHITLDGDRIACPAASVPAGAAAVSGSAPLSDDDTPAHAILAALPPRRAEARLAALPPDRRDAVRTALAIARARGYAVAPSRALRGVTMISAAISTPPARAAGALMVAVRTDRLAPDDPHLIGRALIVAARSLADAEGEAPLGLAPRPRPPALPEPGLRCVLDAAALVGEGPVWNPRRRTLDWVDVLAPAIHRFDPETGIDRVRAYPGIVSAALPATTGDLVLATDRGLVRFDFDTGATVPLLDPERRRPGNRFNDAKCDRKGRIWAGTMALDAATAAGSLYVVEGARAHRADSGFRVSNGLGWSPDDRTFYFADTAAHTVFAYDFDLESGTVTGRRVFLELPPDEGRPDGLTVDAKGHLWIALWDGWRVVRYAPDGTRVRIIEMPVPRPSSCCFGGPDLRTLYITSARIRLSPALLAEAPLSGGLFAIDTDVPGQPTQECRL